MSFNSLLEKNQLHLPILSSEKELGCLQISGVDAIKFLQGQTSCDFNSLTENKSLFGAICNIKGRVIVNFYAVQKEQDIVLIMAKDLVTDILTHLKKYAVFFKVEMSDSSESYAIHHVFSEQTILNKEDEPFSTKHLPYGTLVSLSHHDIHHSLLLSEKLEVETGLLSELNNLFGQTVTHDDASNGLALLSGQPFITKATSERFIPQMLNMQLTQGISFKKGCYTGQEIVARMQYRGNLKKRAYLFSHAFDESAVDKKESLPLMTKLKNKEGRDVADIVASVTLFNNIVFLAVVGDTDASQPILFSDREVMKEALPYSVEDIIQK